MNNKEVLLHLSLIEGVGAATINLLISNLGIENLSSIYHCSTKELIERSHLAQGTAEKIVKGLADRALLDKELKLLALHNHIEYVTRACSAYPPLLQEIYQPPAILYVRGNKELLVKPSLAIVGSRKADYYAQEVIEFLIPDLLSAGLSIASGGALGADSLAHQAALTYGGSTIAILGSGLLNVYPYSNKKLFERIIEHNGLLVSPFSLKTSPLPGNFPARNRVIAGISQGCLVVQADIQSGARITAQFALEQGREVFAVPGSIYHPLSAGCHELIKQGATLVSSCHDIFQQLNLTPAEDAPFLLKATASAIKNTTSSLEKSSRNHNFTSPSHQAVFEVCSAQPSSLDTLLEETALSSTILQSILFDLQIQELIKQDLAGRWVKNKNN